MVLLGLLHRQWWHLLYTMEQEQYAVVSRQCAAAGVQRQLVATSRELAFIGAAC
jgi:hypothetical protein